MPYGQPLRSAAIDPKLAHGGLYGRVYGTGGKHEAGDDIVLVASVGRSLPHEECEPVVAVPAFLDVGETGSIGVLNHDRFGKQFDCEHDAAPSVFVAIQGKCHTEPSRASTGACAVHSVIEWQRYQKVTGDVGAGAE